MAPGFNLDIKKLKNLKLTKEQQQYLVLGVVAVAGSIYGYWNYLLKPLNVQHEYWKKQVAAKEQTLKDARELKKNWAEYESRLARAQEGEQFVGRRIPSTTDFDPLLMRLTKMTLEAGVILNSLRPESTAGPVLVEEGIYKSSAQFEIICTYHQLGEFLSRLSGQEGVYNVDDLSVMTLGIPGFLMEGDNLVRAAMKLIYYSTSSGVTK